MATATLQGTSIRVYVEGEYFNGAKSAPLAKVENKETIRIAGHERVGRATQGYAV